MIKIEIDDEEITAAQARALGGMLLYYRYEDRDLYISKSSAFDDDILVIGVNHQHPELPSYIDLVGNIVHTNPAKDL